MHFLFKFFIQYSILQFMSFFTAPLILMFNVIFIVRYVASLTCLNKFAFNFSFLLENVEGC